MSTKKQIGENNQKDTLFFVDKRRKNVEKSESSEEEGPKPSQKRMKLISNQGTLGEMDEEKYDAPKPSKAELSLAESLFGKKIKQTKGKGKKVSSTKKSFFHTEEQAESEESDSDSEEQEKKKKSKTSSFTPVWVDDEPEDVNVNIVGANAKPRYKKLATKEEIAQSNANTTVVHFKGVKMHPKRVTENVAIHSSVIENRLREQFLSMTRVPTDWANIDNEKEEEDEDVNSILRTAQQKSSSKNTSSEISPLNDSHLRINKLTDANAHQRSQVFSFWFHIFPFSFLTGQC
jgi:hypothetical protein